ncbi:MAG TPA: hypothetical protein VFS43_47310 [Polyangiaceae bacterium]|nr:hypothetical protein [Polyangiaceae bacterium]
MIDRGGRAPGAFVDRLRLSLSLRAGGRAFELTAGSIERVALDHWAYGFEAEIAFAVPAEFEIEGLFEAFVGDDPLELSLSVASCVLDGTGVEAVPIVVSGPALERAVREAAAPGVAGRPVSDRRYRARFADPAAALWRRHRPIELFADASMREVFERHKAPGVALDYAMPRLDERHPLLCVAAGLDGPASFYDFVAWFLDREGAVLEFGAGAYRVAAEKRRPASEAAPIARADVARLEIVAPEPARHAGRVLNADAGAARALAVDNALAADGVRADALVRTPLAARVERRKGAEAARLRPPRHGLEIDFARLPARLDAPGAFVALGEGFGGALDAAGATYRVTRLRLEAGPADVGEGAEPDDPTKAYAASLSLSLEHAADPTPRLPPYAPPRYPVLVEGKIVSESGGDDERTWAFLPGDEGPQYAVDVPLWGKRVPAPFVPSGGPGHWFFPGYKGQRVLVELGFDRASIRRALDWAAGARAPAEGRGDRLVLGRRGVDGTAIEHAYRDGKPALAARRAFGDDRGALEVREGVVFLEVNEDPTASTIEPRYDVSPAVSAAKERLGGEVRAAVDELNGAFERASGEAQAELDAALGELDAAVGEAQAGLRGALGRVEGELGELSSGLASATQPAADALAAAKAALRAALE